MTDTFLTVLTVAGCLVTLSFALYALIKYLELPEEED